MQLRHTPIFAGEKRQREIDLWRSKRGLLTLAYLHHIPVLAVPKDFFLLAYLHHVPILAVPKGRVFECILGPPPLFFLLSYLHHMPVLAVPKGRVFECILGPPLKPVPRLNSNDDKNEWINKINKSPTVKYSKAFLGRPWNQSQELKKLKKNLNRLKPVPRNEEIKQIKVAYKGVSNKNKKTWNQSQASHADPAMFHEPLFSIFLSFLSISACFASLLFFASSACDFLFFLFS